MPRPKKIVEAAPAPASEDTADEQKLTFASAIPNTSFDLLAEADELEARMETVDGFKTAAEIANSFLPLPSSWMALQYIIGRPGIPLNTIVEIMGLETVGKSSFVCALLGNLMAHNVPCLYLNSEPKVLLSDWRRRLFNTDPIKSEKIDRLFERAVYKPVSTYNETDKIIREWIKEKRSVLSKDIPLVIAIDSYTKLLNSEEEETLSWTSSDDKKETTLKGVEDISKKPGVTAKWLHQWCRAITPILRSQNVTIIMVAGKAQDQNANPMLPKDAMDKYNKTRPGGTAMNQSAALQLNLSYKGAVKQGNEPVAKMIEVYVQKNSYGPEKRSIIYTLYDNRVENFRGKDIMGKFIAPAIDMDEALCNLLVARNVFGLTLSAKRYTSAELNLMRVRPADVVKAIYAKQEYILEVAKALSIVGYELK